jgi:hypothetical protein
MPPHEIFPLELVHQVIGELGEAHRWDLHFYPGTAHSGDEYKALQACSLVSKRWIACSRAHMFKKVKLEDFEFEGQPAIIPPAFILPYVKEVEIYYGHEPTKASTIPDLLGVFAMAQIKHLGITGGRLTDQRACIQEFIDTHSTTLQTVEFQHCSLSAHNIADIVLGRHRLRYLRLDWCEYEQLPTAGHLITSTPDPDACSQPVELELSLCGGVPDEGPAYIVAMVAQLPYRFSRLDIDHVAAGDGATEATNALIKANANVLSSLCIRVWAGVYGFLSRKMMLLIVVQPRRRHGD